MKMIVALCLTLVMTGCAVTYRDFPLDALDKKPTPEACDTLYYKVNRFDILDMGGYSKLQSIFGKSEMCRKTVPVDAIPEKGLYVEVQTNYKPLTIAALVFGYISVSTFTILPAWSTRDGYNVQYIVYIDGQKVETYRYEITRKGGVWIGLLPFAWINLLTYNEEEAFQATAYQFASDAKRYLSPELRPALK